MRNLLLVAALVGLAACQSHYKAPTATESVVSQPPANPTGSMNYQSTGTGVPSTRDIAPPNNPTGSMQPQTSGSGPSAGVSVMPPKNPTGSMAYPY